jgi:hypothetical protein
MRMMENGARRFVAKGLFLGVLFYAVSLLFSALFAQAWDWRSWQDPRKRLLYEPVPGNSDIILLGDSIWISSYVKSEEDALWKVLEKLTGKRVFNATLNGADPPDFLNAVKLLPKRETTGTVVFLDVVPTRFLSRNYVEPAQGNYPGEFSGLVADGLIRRFMVSLRKPLLVFDTDIVMNCLLRKTYFSVGDDRPRVWAKDGDFALKRFQTFERYIVDTDDLRRMDWITGLKTALDRKGYRLVIVVTPVNQFLIREYAGKDKAEIYLTRISRARGALVRFLQENQIEYVDCSGEADADGFADLIHTNARGDEKVAEKMAGYIRLHRQE